MERGPEERAWGQKKYSEDDDPELPNIEVTCRRDFCLGRGGFTGRAGAAGAGAAARCPRSPR